MVDPVFCPAVEVKLHKLAPDPDSHRHAHADDQLVLALGSGVEENGLPALVAILDPEAESEGLQLDGLQRDDCHVAGGVLQGEVEGLQAELVLTWNKQPNTWSAWHGP